MSNGDRGAIFALGLVAGIAICAVFAIWSYPWFSDPSYQAEGGVYEQSQNGRQNEDETKPITGRFFTTQDTIAQWAMAVLALAATGISIWAVALIRETLAETRRATSAAQDTVAETRRIGEAQTRAYVAVTSCVFGSVGGFATAKLTIKNCGQTPAHRVILDFKSGVHEAIDMSFVRVGGPNHILTPKQTLAAGSEAQIDAKSDVGYNGALINNLDAGSHIFVVNGLVRYFDVFGRQWEQEFQFATGGMYGYDGERMMGSKQYMPEKEITDEKPSTAHYHVSGESVTLTVNRKK